MRWEGTVGLHANTCSVIIPPAESLLGNVIHHPADATSTDRGGGSRRRRIVKIDRWLRNSPASLLYIPELILIKVVIGQEELPAMCLWPFRQRDKCQVSQVSWDRKMLIHILLASASASQRWYIIVVIDWPLSRQRLLNEIFHPQEKSSLHSFCRPTVWPVLFHFKYNLVSCNVCWAWSSALSPAQNFLIFLSSFIFPRLTVETS